MTGTREEGNQAAIGNVLRRPPAIGTRRVANFRPVERPQKGGSFTAPAARGHRWVAPTTVRKVDTEVSLPSFVRIKLLQFIGLLLQVYELKISAGFLDAEFEDGHTRVNERVPDELD